MKKILTLTAVGVILTAPAMAVVQCVGLDAKSATCTLSQPYGKADWSTTCTTNGTSVPIKGIAMCSNQAADELFATSDAITTVSSTSDKTNVNCWCKMVEPAVSSWVFVYAETSAGNCAYNCAIDCVGLVKTMSSFRSALFGSLAN